jgi:beta-lactamase regulating signal transducer with metallopeptidase domain
MSELFLTVLNMSLTASYVILFVILIRLLLKKAPKVISYALWGVVAFRLIIPFSFESMFSLMPRNTNPVPIPHDIIYQQSPQINSGIEVVDSFVSQSLPAPTIGASVNPLQIYVEIGAYIWVLGIIALLIYSLVSILILKRQLKSAQLIEKNIFEAKNLKTPFVLGLIRPKIYLPVGLNATERSYILLHEQTHIHRKDHIIKVLAFLILSVSTGLILLCGLRSC